MKRQLLKEGIVPARREGRGAPLAESVRQRVPRADAPEAAGVSGDLVANDRVRRTPLLRISVVREIEPDRSNGRRNAKADAGRPAELVEPNGFRSPVVDLPAVNEQCELEQIPKEGRPHPQLHVRDSQRVSARW